MDFQEKKVICLMGPTGSGKTAFALEWVKKFPFEIISVDSALVYREMDIGTAKPSSEELRYAPHHLINLCDPPDHYSAADFRRDAVLAIEAIVARGHVPLCVGGTMLYFHVLMHGIASLPSRDVSIRQAISEEAEKMGWPFLHAQLKEWDPVASERIHPNDAQRLQRAFEIYALTGKSLTQHFEESISCVLPYRFLPMALCPERSRLHANIEQRFDQMLHLGLIEEVERLRSKWPISLDNPSMRSVGYRQVWQYLEGTYDEEMMRFKAIVATRQLAKRQITWLRRFEGAKWFAPDQKEEIEREITFFLQA